MGTAMTARVRESEIPDDQNAWRDSTSAVSIGQWFTGSSREPEFKVTWEPDETYGDGPGEITETFVELPNALKRVKELLSNSNSEESLWHVGEPS